MKKLIYLLPLLLFACSAETTQQASQNDIETQGFECPSGTFLPNAIGTIEAPFQGDILISQNKQAGVVNRLWSNRTIPVYFDSRYEGTEQKELVYKAFEEFESLGFTFIELSEEEFFEYQHTTDINRVYIKWSGVAVSYVGVLGGEQELYLPVFWNTFYDTTLHELGHLVGLWHPHNTPMQDEWLTVNRDNIKPEYLSFFDVFEDENFEYGDSYDIYSVMNYNSYDFAIDTSIPTMTLKDGTLFDSQPYLSDGDKLSIKRMYECFELNN